MNALLKELLQMPEARALLDSTLRRDKPMVTGVSPVHRAMLAAAMLQDGALRQSVTKLAEQHSQMYARFYDLI
jgi:hypothetical protein